MKLNITMKALAIVAALLANIGIVKAQDVESLPDFRYVVRPVPGVYFDPSQSGTGLTIDTIPANGQTIAFATYYHYDPNGAPTWLNKIAPIVPATTAQYTVDGIPATVRGPWIAAAAGQCFDCAYAANTVSYPPYGERVMNVIDGRWLQLPASGNAATRNMQLGKTAQPSAAMSLALLESGAVWQSRNRYYYPQGVENLKLSGLVRFARRHPSKKWTFLAPLAVSQLPDGQGGFLPATQPAWLDVPGLNSIETQYQIEQVLVSAAVGFPSALGVSYDPTFQELANSASTSTFVIQTQTGAIHGIGHSIGGASFNRDNAVPIRASYVTWAGTTDEGQPRLIIRVWDRRINTWFEEIELTRVSDDYRKLVLPNYVPNANPRPLF